MFIQFFANKTFLQNCSNSTFSPWLQPIFSYRNATSDQDYHSMASNEKTWIEIFFGMSFMYYSVFGSIVTIFVGIIASWIAGEDDGSMYSLKLLHPIIRKFIKTSKTIPTNDVVSVPRNLEMKNSSSVYNVSESFENVMEKFSNYRKTEQ